MPKFYEVNGTHTIALYSDDNGWKIRWIHDSLANVTAKHNPDQPLTHQFESYGCFLNVVFDSFSYEDIEKFMEVEKALGFLYTKKEIEWHLFQLSR